MSLTLNVGMRLNAAYGLALDLETVQSTLAEDWSLAFGSGSGANNVSKIFSDTRTIALSSSENLDLAGVLLDAFGQVLTFTKVRGLWVRADSANVNNVLVGGAASNGFLFLSDPTDIVPVRPGGWMSIVAPDVNGIPVTAATGDILKVANSGAGTSVTYKIIIAGE